MGVLELETLGIIQNRISMFTRRSTVDITSGI